MQNNEYVSPESVVRNLSSGRTTLYVNVRDKWGNTFNREVRGLVVPGPAILPVFLTAFWLALFAVAIIFAPSNTFCHDLLMNPWVRNYGSFGLFPLAMTVLPPVRRQILRRYLRNVKADPSFAEWQDRFVIPTEHFIPENFGTLLLRHRKMLLLGQSGIGKTSYFRYLTSLYTRENNDLPPVGVVPIFLPLSRYKGESVEKMFYAQLANYGRLTDEVLVNRCLLQGGFLIFIDSLNEIDEAQRNQVNSFVDQHWNANYLCVSSQEGYPEFTGLEKAELEPLEPAKIREFLQLRLGPEEADSVIREFTEELYKEYRIPQDLEFVIELKKQGRPLPLTKQALYNAVLEPILQSWIMDGRSDYPYLLFHRAYEMLTKHETYFDRDSVLPEPLRDRLIEKKVLIRRGNHFHFRHDLGRSFLASRYFAPNWESLLGPKDIVIDSNWRPMLEFSVLEINDPNETKRMLYRVLDKNGSLAGILFKWLSDAHAALCRDWADEFKRKYGEAMLK
jgi:hypothetical protein